MTDVSQHPTHGWTHLGQAVHAHTKDHLPDQTPYARFNKRLAILVTDKVGTMTCAYVFSIISLCSLPAVLSAFHIFANVFPGWMIKASLIALIAWIAQTYIQLVLLSVIMVGQNVQSEASDARAAKTFEDTEHIVQLLRIDTDHGLQAILDGLRTIHSALAKVDPDIPPLPATCAQHQNA